VEGPKPILLAETDPEWLFYILSGGNELKSETHSSVKNTGRQELEFGCNQVILVRNQESKDKIPVMLRHALCLTLYEAKGLEFDDVILYNFFADSTISD